MAKILIIDDDPDIVESMRIVLGNKGYDVSVSPDGQEGLMQLKETKPDLIILDVVMPNIDGFEVSREIRKDPSNKNIPILMLTAVRQKIGLDFKKEAGNEEWLPVDEYCEKPLNHDDLLGKVEKLLESKNQ